MTLRIPSATYRLQLHKGFGFHDAARMAGYLQRLGISDLYVSPIFKAAPGSTHGYDVLDHAVLNPELGGAEGFQALTDAAKTHGLGLIVDFVPNHMGVGSDGNSFWEDVLEHGRSSERAEYFDIDWQPPKETLAHKLLLPILPDQYGVTLEQGYFTLFFDGQAVRLRAGARNLPVRPQSLGKVLSRAADLLEGKALPAQTDELRALGRSFAELSEGDPEHPAETEAYRSNARVLQQQLRDFLAASDLRTNFEQTLATLSGTPSQSSSFDFLDEILRVQHYRLSAWQLALEAVNYRRFFDVTDLASLRVELPAVFDASHRTLLSLVEQHKIDGIRLDHVDGLFDPIGYLRQLAEALDRVLPDSDPAELPIYVVVEKILAADEVLPARFRAHGTTGYEFARAVTGVLVDRRSESNLSNTYRHFTSDTWSFEQHLLQAKRDVLASLLASDATMLSRALERLAEQDRRWRDLTWNSLHAALTEVMAAFGAYRSYLRPDGTRTPEDEALINRAVADAIRRNPTAGRGAYLFLRALLLADRDLPGATAFAMRFQQTTGPVTAKALEDTAFYRYTRNVAENEVGGRPDRVGLELDEFHAHNAREQREYPLTMTTTSTHDTKRGEDARARLAMLSELPNTWRRTAHELRRLAAKHRHGVDGNEAPARGDEYLFYQTLVGVIPFRATESDVAQLTPRLQDYMRKAAREAKTQTSWLHPNDEYESALADFVRGTLEDRAFVSRILRFCKRIDPYGACKALAQLTLKLCSPGVPDTYQGSETWHQALVDPDNRRPVDYESLEQRLHGLDERRAERLPLIADLLAQFEDGRLKTFVASELMRLRRAQPALFRSPYTELEAGSDVVAFGRGHDECRLVCAVTRFPFRATRGRNPWPLAELWQDQSVRGPELDGSYRNVLTGESLTVSSGLRLAELFRHLPIAVLTKE